MKTFSLTAAFVLTSLALLLAQGSQAANEALWQAAATPAISDDLIVLRTMGHLHGVGQ